MKSMNSSNFKTRTSHWVLQLQYIVLTFFWLVFIGLLVTALLLFTFERSSNASVVNDILNKIGDPNTSESEKVALYQQLLAIKYPIIDFSLMNFIKFGTAAPITDYPAAWAQRLNDINIAYSYIFITILIALIGFVFYIVTIFKLFRRATFDKYYGLETKFPNDYPIYDVRMYLDFTLNLAIVFGFFNFLTTLVVLLYGVILVLVSYFFWYILRVKNETLVVHKWWKSPNFVLFLSILLIQNGYNILKVIFAQQFDVNLELIISILFPIGTITVMVAILIRNMLNTKVSAILKAIKTIDARISAFRIFYYTQEEKSLEDYTFVSQLPILIKIPLQNNNITEKEAFQLMTLINDASKFFEANFKKDKERKYMLYHLFNNVTQVEEIKEIEANILKLQSFKN